MIRQPTASSRQKKALSDSGIGVIQQRIFGLPVDRKVLFSNHKKAYRSRIEKRQRKLIIKVSFLKPFVRQTEKILCITTCYSPVTLFEKIGIGWIFIYLKRSLLVFTDQRILHIPTTPSYKYRQSIAEIPYAGCSSVQVKGRSLVVVYRKNGIVEKFFSLAGREKKKIVQLLKTIPNSGQVANISGRIRRCPRCAAVLPKAGKPCVKCGLKFKKGIAAALLALVFPGGGYLYVRQYSLGAITALLELFLAGVVAVTLRDMAAGIETGSLWPALYAAGLVTEKILVAAHAVLLTKEVIPCKRKIEFQLVRNR